MSRTIPTCVTLPLTGTSITIPFPDIARPVPGGWQVAVSLRATSGDAGDAKISVLQGAHIVASTTVTPTTSFSPFGLSVSEEDLQQVSTGLCHISSLVVVISEAVTVPCCGTTALDLFITCDLGTTRFSRSSTTEYIWPQNTAGECFPGQGTPYDIVCDAGNWYLAGPPGGSAPMTGSCNPVVSFSFSMDGHDYRVSE